MLVQTVLSCTDGRLCWDGVREQFGPQGALGSCALPSAQSRANLAQLPQGLWAEVHTPHFVPSTQKEGRAALLFFSLILLWNANTSLMLVPGVCVVSLLSSGDLLIFLREGHIHELRSICRESHWCFNIFFLLQACPKQTGHFYGLNDSPIENSLVASPFVSQA